jgi:hypothetical protein
MLLAFMHLSVCENVPLMLKKHNVLRIYLRHREYESVCSQTRRRRSIQLPFSQWFLVKPLPALLHLILVLL